MKTEAMLLVAALLSVQQASATFIVISDVREVSASGVAGGFDGGQHYSETEAHDQTSAFSGNVAGSADWVDSTPWHPDLPPGYFHAESRARQTSVITENGISLDVDLWGQSWVALWGPYSGVTAAASSLFEITFRIETPVVYQLGVSNFSRFGHDLPGPVIDITLSSLALGDIVTRIPFEEQSGVLLPDTYTIRSNASFLTVPDPLGDLKHVAYHLDFEVHSIPDGSSTAAMLGAVLIAIARIRRRF